MDDILAKVSESLRLIQEEGGQGNLVIFIANADKNYYIQIVGHKDDPTLFAEAVSNAFLDTKYRLDPRQMKLMEELGWKCPGKTPNFHREWSAKDRQERIDIAQGIIETLIETYGWIPEQGLETEISLE
ncbi:MAG: hypothetical protein PVF74_06805 [Anaerolineales bacterium]